MKESTAEDRRQAMKHQRSLSYTTAINQSCDSHDSMLEQLRAAAEASQNRRGVTPTKTDNSTGIMNLGLYSLFIL